MLSIRKKADTKQFHFKSPTGAVKLPWQIGDPELMADFGYTNTTVPVKLTGVWENVTRRQFIYTKSRISYLFTVIWPHWQPPSNVLTISCHNTFQMICKPLIVLYIYHCKLQWNLSVTTTSLIELITCDLFSNVFWWRLKLPIYSC